MNYILIILFVIIIIALFNTLYDDREYMTNNEAIQNLASMYNEGEASVRAPILNTQQINATEINADDINTSELNATEGIEFPRKEGAVISTSKYPLRTVINCPAGEYLCGIEWSHAGGDPWYQERVVGKCCKFY